MTVLGSRPVFGRDFYALHILVYWPELIRIYVIYYLNFPAYPIDLHYRWEGKKRSFNWWVFGFGGPLQKKNLVKRIIYWMYKSLLFNLFFDFFRSCCWIFWGIINIFCWSAAKEMLKRIIFVDQNILIIWENFHFCCYAWWWWLFRYGHKQEK